MRSDKDLSIRKKSGRKRKKKNPFRTADTSHLLTMSYGFFGGALVAFLLTVAEPLRGVGLAGGMLALLAGVGCLLGFVLGRLSAHELIFLEDVVQMRKGKDVVGEIPYANVATANLVYLVDEETGQTTTVLRVTLYKSRDKDTWWPSTVKKEDYDIQLSNDYRVPLTAVQRGFLEGVERHLEKKTGLRRSR